jgi:hypothetical protein
VTGSRSSPGATASISASFFRRDPALICFSRAMAAAISSKTSKYTSRVHRYRLVKPRMTPDLCSWTRFARFDVTPE